MKIESKKCPVCSTEMTIVQKNVEVEGPAVSGGYFGERGEEYGISSSGRTLGVGRADFWKCPKCEYEEEKTVETTKTTAVPDEDDADVSDILTSAKEIRRFRCHWMRMKAVVIGYLPVPEDHYIGCKIQLTCPWCKKTCIVRFYPQSSADYNAFDRLDLPVKLT